MSGNPPSYDPRAFGARCPCGTRVPRQPPSRQKKGYGRFCSRACFADSRKKRRGDRYVGHGGAANGREHTKVVEVALGRGLTKSEEVHHVNENRADNRPVNLVVCASQRAHAMLHAHPHLLKTATWVGRPEASVRTFDLPAQPGMRFCAGHGLLRPVVQFDRGAKYADGYRSICKECRKVRGT